MINKFRGESRMGVQRSKAYRSIYAPRPGWDERTPANLFSCLAEFNFPWTSIADNFEMSQWMSMRFPFSC